jgi:site-specific DNA recombinase
VENGAGRKRVVVYIRVSSDEQFERGYSVPDQKRDLTSQTEARGWTLIETVVDDGYSGAVGSRPGLDRIMQLAEEGKIDVVLAKKRNRFFRSRYHRLLYERSLSELGVKLIALDDTGNRFADAMNDEFADWYRDEVTKNTKAGRLEKTRQGKIIASHTPIYGFAYNETRDGYVIHEEHMAVVRRAMEELAEGKPIHRVKRGLEADGIPSPGGRVLWEHKTIKEFTKEEAYYAVPYHELAPKLSAEAREGLDPEGAYGIVWYPRRKVKSLDPDPANGYRRGQSVTLYARQDQVPIPVPYSGIPASVIDAARESVRNNGGRPSRLNGGRTYELGGILRCAVCGNVMTASTRHQRGKVYCYYRCARYQREGRLGCEMNRSLKAEHIENEVLNTVLDAVKNKDELTRKAEEEFEQKKHHVLNGSLTDVRDLLLAPR